MERISQLSLRHKLAIPIVALVIICFVILTWMSQSTLSDQLHRDLERELRSVGLLTASSLDPSDVEAVMGVTDETDEAFVHLQNQLETIMEKQGIMYWSYIWQMEGDSVIPLGFTKNLEDVYNVGESFDNLASIHIEGGHQAIESGEPVVTDVFEDDFGTWSTVFSPIENEHGETVAVIGIDYSAEYIDSILGELQLSQWLTAIMGTLIVACFVYFVVNGLLKPLKQVVQVTNKVADGDLAVPSLEVRSKDEVGQMATALNQMVQSLRGLIQNMAYASEQVAASSQQVAAASNQTEQAANEVVAVMGDMAEGARVSQQAAEDTAKATEENAQGIQRIAQSSAVVAESAQKTAAEASQGNDIIQNVVKQMQSVSESVNQAGKEVQELGERSSEIGKIVELITNIANQTNLLALNASIEAARAGENGRGFAVVAGEVGKLAEQSAASAKQITDIIAEIQTVTERSVESMATGTKDAEEGLASVNEAGEVFQRILGAAQQVAAQVEEVSSVSEQLSANSEEVAASVQELTGFAEETTNRTDNVTTVSKEQLAAMKEIAASSDSLTQMAEQLQESMNQFKLEQQKDVLE
ncbi:methyl-accepting chemotaxis protein [Shouchella clausii]|uniref:methyl-accepting chemotaxis protein n=1 Tax=Shouchella clausii TaxID=79880 RepID=UPI00280BB402|nr:methyl-accepting chemotaxis protein [Shouchella clausii]WMM34161.1 methyl-accepting chemotaxis protein [Shouchella clausii]